MFRNYQSSQIKENIKKWIFERVDFFISSISFVSITTPVLILFLPFVKSIKALSKKRDKTVTILRLLSYF